MTTRTDNFNRTDSTTTIDSPSDSGGNYSIGGGALTKWGISSNQGYIATDGGNGTTAAVLDASSAVVTVQVTIAAIGTQRLGPIARWQDQNSFWAIAAWTASFRLYRFASGSPTQMGETFDTVANGDVLKLDVDSSNNWTAYLNGTSKITVSADSTYSTATKHGLYGGNTGHRFDDLTITDNSTPPPIAKVINSQLMFGR
jgi:hypothetical protein